MGSLQVALQNDTGSDAPVFVTITGQAAEDPNQVVFIQADGITQYRPGNPAQDGAPLEQDVAIRLNGSGAEAFVAQIPFLVSGRIWFSIGESLEFRLNQGGNGFAARVQPSVTSSADPNNGRNFSFSEFTYTSTELFANITNVDLVGIPNGITITSTSGATQNVPGIPADGLQQIIDRLNDQAGSDSRPWNELVQNNGLRVISPESYRVFDDLGLRGFEGYFEDYVNSVWQRYSGGQTVNVNIDSATYQGTVTNDQLVFNDPGRTGFTRPSTTDIFANSEGALADKPTGEGNAIRTRLAAALNRTHLQEIADQPFGATLADFYNDAVTNHYARIVHEVEIDGIGYTFPFDDVPVGPGPPGSTVDGAIRDGTPQLFTVTIGAASRTTNAQVIAKRQAKLIAGAKKVVGVPVHRQASLLAKA